jgi:hypothetical protein
MRLFLFGRPRTHELQEQTYLTTGKALLLLGTTEITSWNGKQGLQHSLLHSHCYLGLLLPPPLLLLCWCRLLYQCRGVYCCTPRQQLLRSEAPPLGKARMCSRCHLLLLRASRVLSVLLIMCDRMTATLLDSWDQMMTPLRDSPVLSSCPMLEERLSPCLAI